MTIFEWSSCPSCKMPALFPDFKKLIEYENVCPMCEQQIDPMTIILSNEPDKDFKELANLMKDSSPDDEKN